jgi:nitroreductase
MDTTSIDEVLTTTRSVRKRLDLERDVPPELIKECLDIAVQAPTGGNSQGWHFLVITDAQKKAEIGELYRESFFIYARARDEQAATQGQGELYEQQQMRVVKSAVFLANNMGRVPAMVIPCIHGRVETLSPMAQAGLYGSILPATWSFMLALRARGLGAAWTTLHLRYEKEIAAILNIPDQVTQAALLPVAYYTGDTFQPAKRIPAAEVTSWNEWGQKE